MKLWSKLTAPFRRRKLDAEMDEKMRLHLQRRAEENVARGMRAGGRRGKERFG